MLKRVLLIFIAISLLLTAFPQSVYAGFGISPPYVRSTSLLPGSRYEQKIMLLRSSAEEDLEANITIEAPDIKDWLTIDKGTKFDLPKNELQVPMTVTVNAPKEAELGNYTGYINIRVSPKNKAQGSGVSIALGARIDVELALTDKATPDFKIRTVNIPSIEMLGSPWNWPILRWFFYRLKVDIKFENTGNIKTAPSKVTLDVYDLTEKNLLESLSDKSLEKVEPYEIKDIQASFPITLDKGQYWGKVKIYKDNEVVNSYKIAFTVAERGTLPSGRIKLGYWPWVLAGALLLIVAGVLYLLVRFRAWRLVTKLLFGLIAAVLSFAGKRMSSLFSSLNKKFWKWMKDKASKYDE